MKKLLIIGASSYVGARLYFDLKDKFETIGTFCNTKLSKSFVRLDITKPNDVKNLILKYKPNIIIHAAANASVKWCEEHPIEAKEINENATTAIVKAANIANANIIYISSFAAQDKSKVYGRTKAKSEQVIKSYSNNYVILRASLVIGLSPNLTNDRPFNRILKNIEEMTPAVYDVTWKFQPTYIGHLSKVIITTIDRELNSVTIPVAVSALKSRYDIAKDILGKFKISVSATKEQNKTPAFYNNLSILKKLKLPRYRYKQVIEIIDYEIRNKNIFKV